MAAVLEYITAEILELAGDLTHQSKFKTIKPKHINLGIRSDAELFKLFHSVQISDGGQPLNLPAQPEKKGKASNWLSFMNTYVNNYWQDHIYFH